MYRVAVPAERIGEPVQLGQEPRARGDLPRRDRVEGGDSRPQIGNSPIALAAVPAHAAIMPAPRTHTYRR